MLRHPEHQFKSSWRWRHQPISENHLKFYAKDRVVHYMHLEHTFIRRYMRIYQTAIVGPLPWLPTSVKLRRFNIISHDDEILDYGNWDNYLNVETSSMAVPRKWLGEVS